MTSPARITAEHLALHCPPQLVLSGSLLSIERPSKKMIVVLFSPPGAEQTHQSNPELARPSVVTFLVRYVGLRR